MYAHSSPSDSPDIGPHLYADHIRAVEIAGLAYLDEALRYSSHPEQKVQELRESLRLALRIHDIGKLEASNQAVLSGKKTGKLEYDHVDGGCALAIKLGDSLAAWLIRAHHAPGLPSLSHEKLLDNKRLALRGKRWNRDNNEKARLDDHKQLRDRTDTLVDDLKESHENACDQALTITQSAPPDDALTTRLLLSCLVDADHGDTAQYYQAETEDSTPSQPLPNWEARLAKLRTHIDSLPKSPNQRKKLRDRLFEECSKFSTHHPIVSCAAPVGLGKTTAVMAYLLNCAIKNNLRRVFVIAPFTNVISQTAKTLKEIIVLEGENPDLVVAEHHHRAEFSAKNMRQYSQLWKAPIVVTTAVQFFETLASASPSSLRKLHALPGSAIFIDESHACVPPKYLNIAWHWLESLSKNWGCQFALASGSLCKFWEKPQILGKGKEKRILSILSDDFYRNSSSAEHNRVEFSRLNEGALSKEKLVEMICEPTRANTSRLVILNTVQSAAAIAKELRPDSEEDSPLGERTVLHLSTALTPKDRVRIIDEITSRQIPESQWKNKGWILVATSCVEAGVNLDFNFGFRESCSVTSFLQTAGRVNREDKFVGSILFDFTLIHEGLINRHPGVKNSTDVFEQLWDDIVSGQKPLDDLATTALIKEISKSGEVSEVLRQEKDRNFQEVQKGVRIIDSDTKTVVVDGKIAKRLAHGVPVPFKELQDNSVQIWSNKIASMKLKPVNGSDEIYELNYRYESNFLGYMQDMELFVTGNQGIVL